MRSMEFILARTASARRLRLARRVFRPLVRLRNAEAENILEGAQNVPLHQRLRGLVIARGDELDEIAVLLDGAGGASGEANGNANEN